MSLQDQVRKTSQAEKVYHDAWGLVTGVGPPVTVRLARDQTDVTVTLWLSSYTPTTSDKVLLVRTGQQWVIVGDLVDA